MFALLSILWQWIFGKPTLKYLLLGIDNAGKTTVILTLRNSKNKQTVPTVGLNIARLEIDGASVCIWDLGGQSALRKMWTKYYEEASGILFCIDGADPERFNEALQELERISENESVGTRMVKMSVLVNKCDKVPDGEAVAEKVRERCLAWKGRNCVVAILWGSALNATPADSERLMHFLVQRLPARPASTSVQIQRWN